ncbi:MAG: hypothetical protein AVDCRST_MAG11-3269, partial [uncultured Gemmatimonadaceae bacterium]
ARRALRDAGALPLVERRDARRRRGRLGVGRESPQAVGAPHELAGPLREQRARHLLRDGARRGGHLADVADERRVVGGAAGEEVRCALAQERLGEVRLDAPAHPAVLPV